MPANVIMPTNVTKQAFDVINPQMYLATAYYKHNTQFPTNVITIKFAGISYVCGDVKIFIVITY